MVFRKYKKDRRKSEKTNTDERTTTPFGGSFPLRLLLSLLSLSLSQNLSASLFSRERVTILLLRVGVISKLYRRTTILSLIYTQRLVFRDDEVKKNQKREE